MTNMTDSQFDQIIREKMLSIKCEVDDSLWDGIAAKMAARRRRVVFLRYVYGAVAAAACVALGLFLFNTADAPSQLQSAPSFAAVESVVPQELDTPADAQDIPSIAEQVKALRSSGAVAQVHPAEAAKIAEVLSVISSSEEQQEPSTEDAEEPQKTSSVRSAESAAQPSRNTYRTPSGSELMDDFYLFEEDDTNKDTHASISISSNVSGIARQGGFAYQMAPSHSASATGGSGSILVEEYSESSYSIPLSFGVQMRFPVAGKVALGAGVNYTYLQRSFSALVNKVQYGNASSRMHYVGLTASVYYNFIESGRLSLYGRAGGAVDKAVSAGLVYGDNSMRIDASGVQWSVNAGVGLEYRIAGPVALFVDPSASYYFDCNQPKSIRTEQPLMFSLEAGVRFKMGNQ